MRAVCPPSKANQDHLPSVRKLPFSAFPPERRERDALKCQKTRFNGIKTALQALQYWVSANKMNAFVQFLNVIAAEDQRALNTKNKERQTQTLLLPSRCWHIPLCNAATHYQRQPLKRCSQRSQREEVTTWLFEKRCSPGRDFLQGLREQDTVKTPKEYFLGVSSCKGPGWRLSPNKLTSGSIIFLLGTQHVSAGSRDGAKGENAG